MTRTLVVAALMLAPSVASAQMWPMDDEWVVIECGAEPSFDPVDDEPGATNERDVVGDATHPALYLFVDDNHAYFRMRVEADPLTAGGDFRPFGWGVEMDTDLDRTSYELLVQVDGVANPDEVVLGRNTNQRAANDPSDPIEDVLSTYDATTHARAVPAENAFASSFGGDPDFFVDWAVPLADLAAEGVTPSSPVVLFFGTSASAAAIDADLACHVGGTARTLSGVGTDVTRPDGVIVVDTDGDGLSDAEEITIGTDPNRADTDGDGFTDAVEVRAGTDPTDAMSFPDGGPSPSGIGIRGGPGGCAVGASSAAPALPAGLLLALALMVRWRRVAR